MREPLLQCSKTNCENLSSDCETKPLSCFSTLLPVLLIRPLNNWSVVLNDTTGLKSRRLRVIDKVTS